jgi:glycosyltransferase involved in cell wall biosynthesis
MLLWTVRNRDFDLIHAHTAYPDGLAALLFGKAVKKPVLITAHGSDINLYPEESRIGKILVCFALRHCDAVVAVSGDLKNRIEKLGVDRAKVRVIHNGIDIALFSPMDKENAVSQKGLSRQDKRILYTGGLLPVKGVGVLIEAMSILAISRNDIEMVLVGADKKGRTDREFIHMAKNIGLQEMVIFVNKVRNTEIPLWLAASDVFVLPSLSEGFGLSLVEALACGKPVVSTTCGGPEDIVTEEVGLLVPPGDAKTLASAIAYVLDHPEKYDPVRISSYARQRFNLEKIASQIFDLYRSLCKVTC